MPTVTKKTPAVTGADTPLGVLPTQIVGAAYHDAEVRPGEPVALEREPANPNDADAVLVLNGDCEAVGHLPRQVAAWLSPLVDAGRVRAAGKVAATWHGGGDRGAPIPLDLELALARKGRPILEPVADPATPEQALHEAVRRAFVDAAAYTRPEVVEGLAARLAALAKRVALPESRMLRWW